MSSVFVILVVLILVLVVPNALALTHIMHFSFSHTFESNESAPSRG